MTERQPILGQYDSENSYGTLHGSDADDVQFTSQGQVQDKVVVTKVRLFFYSLVTAHAMCI